MHTFFDDLIGWNCLQKELENDTLIYIEGIPFKKSIQFLSKEEF